ncbi:hypothetical protein GF420_08395 [candidate division GN15 bacterium]|nr:hypothetical protein [candidate division GN15 bacterium]
MNDQRKYVRRPTNDYFVVFDDTTGQPLGRLLNLSSEGLLLMTAEEVAIPTTLQCRLVFPAEIKGQTEIRFAAESRWGRHNAKNDWFETGFKITSISDPHRQILAYLVSEQLVEKASP